ncbi:MAG TPA: hypothetical protein VE053_06815 [Allosphingosinicella sp.]|nr:hypothetical protein [Allosphingosinicella sp.]
MPPSAYLAIAIGALIILPGIVVIWIARRFVAEVIEVLKAGQDDRDELADAQDLRGIIRSRLDDLAASLEQYLSRSVPTPPDLPRVHESGNRI